MICNKKQDFRLILKVCRNFLDPPLEAQRREIQDNAVQCVLYSMSSWAHALWIIYSIKMPNIFYIKNGRHFPQKELILDPLAVGVILVLGLISKSFCLAATLCLIMILNL